ncbi:hypothetical protein ABC977_00405 [Thioalkalicoccus limnaeus]|uniref:Glucosamine inositolphosphorylceramide transferase 1 N-terminal domain-containing protein n=1 Tax=Thioalkalicoccus limnaeus TaxID=120681 RepID=A0ABV4B963_9GAMM
MALDRPVQHLLRWWQKRRDRRVERQAWPQWFLLVGRVTHAQRCAPNPLRLTPVQPPADRFWADPFLWFAGPRPYVFVEEYVREIGRGRISVLELDGDLQPCGPAVPVLDEARHLSYPFLFEYQGQLYMVPESARTRRVDLYRCEDFPYRWVRLHSLLAGIEAADATLFEHEGRWWLFCAARLGSARLNESLFAFHADSPLSRHWIPHSGNPLVRSFRCGRPAGRIFEDPAGGLIRPGQDSVPRYGFGIGLYRIETLTPDRYRERCIWRSDGQAAGGWRAMHHMDGQRDLLVMDAQRLLSE